MYINHKLQLLINAFIFILLLSSGIGLFFVRAHHIPRLPNIDLKVGPYTASEQIINGQYLVLFKKDANNIEEVLKPLNLELVFPILDWVLVAQKNKKNFLPINLNSPEAQEDLLVINSLLKHPSVLDAQHNFSLEVASTDEITNAKIEQHLASRQNNNYALNMPEAWDISTGSPEVKVAVIDNFLQKEIFSFAQRFKACSSRIEFIEPFGHEKKSNLPSTHGELMLLALGACNTHSPFSMGIDSHSRLLAVQRASPGHAQTMAAALYSAGINICEQSAYPCPKNFENIQANKKADIILLPFANSAPDLLQFFSDMLDAISQKNCIVVSAAGNNGADATNFFPGNSSSIINVGALNLNGTRSTFSNWGPAIDILAPGENIDINYANLTKTAAGTSISAAFVAGTLSLMKALDSTLSWKSALYFLTHSLPLLSCENYCLSEENKNSDEQSNCSDLCCRDQNISCGATALDAAQALKNVQNKYIDTGLLELDRSYLIFTRAHPQAQSIQINNVGSESTEVETLLYDDNLVVTPARFSLDKKGFENDRISLDISYKDEPFKRKTSKIEFIVRKNDLIRDRSSVFIEYIPK
ncbi:MAG: S8/S53 family peptidase [Myxococcales bacterium]|nr:S8/S53 family peptidase [Myxococcales bacterium]USN51287.1 MAG: S8/S53 family peptidase [Myxococcales bacterium]